MIKNVIFNNSVGEEIKGILKRKNKAEPLLIVCHGYKSSKNHPALESITDKLYKMGVATYSFNFSKSAQGVDLKRQVEDIIDIANFFQDYKDIIILAGSFGALSGAIAANQSTKIKGIITVNGFFGKPLLGVKLLVIYLLFRIRMLFNTNDRITWSYLKNEYKPEIISKDTLIMHGGNDNEVFISQSKDFYRKVKGGKKFYILKNADHHLTRDEYRQETAEEIDKWLKNRVKQNLWLN